MTLRSSPALSPAAPPVRAADRGVAGQRGLPGPDAPQPDPKTCTVAELLLRVQPAIRLRSRVRDSQLLRSVTLADLISDPLRLDDFLARCRRLPQCGDGQVTRIRAALVAAIRAAQANPDPAVLGQAPEEPPAGAPLPVQGLYHPDSVEAIRSVYLRMWRLAQFERFVYLPGSLPEFVKTPALLKAELGSLHDLQDYAQALAMMRIGLANTLRADGLILIDRHMLEAVLRRQGRYAAMTAGEVAEQRALLCGMKALLPSTIRVVVTDFETARLTPAAIIGEDVVLYAMGGYAVLRAPAMLSGLLARCRDAAHGGCTLETALQAIG
jgi:hypothetical protein